MAINPEEFGASFKDFLDQMRTHKKPEEAPFFVRKLEEHFATNPASLPVVSQMFPKLAQANLHMAMEAYLAGEGRSADVFGIIGLHGFGSKGLASLVAPAGGFGGDAKEGPVEYTNVTLDNGRILA